MNIILKMHDSCGEESKLPGGGGQRFKAKDDLFLFSLSRPLLQRLPELLPCPAAAPSSVKWNYYGPETAKVLQGVIS